jgi:hypothetical protein
MWPRRYGVARQTVHDWLRRYANEGGLVGLTDRSSRSEGLLYRISVRFILETGAACPDASAPVGGARSYDRYPVGW